jgi:probable rRNA maturation factor
MKQSSIQFHNADIAFVLPRKTILRSWIQKVCRNHQFSVSQIQFVFCSDEYLLDINRQFLQHDYYTDIITFDNTQDHQVELEAYISLDRVRDNAKQNKETIQRELHRVMIHGVLHALGYKDKKSSDVKAMRAAEENALIAWEKLCRSI